MGRKRRRLVGSGHEPFHGVFPSLPTICYKNGEIDEMGQRSVVRYCVNSGAHGLACLLFAGEFYKFSEAERKRIVRIVVDEVNGGVPVLVGISHSGTLPSIELGRDAKDAGADGIIAAPPYHMNFTEETARSLRKHYLEIGGKVDLPMMIQEYETEGGVKLEVKDIEAICRGSSRVRYLKVEGLDHLKRIAEVQRLAGVNVGIFGGMAGRYLIEELRLGSTGSIPGVELTGVLVKTYEAWEKGELKLARRTYRTVVPYLEFLISHFASFTSVQKETLKAIGVISNASVRQPAVPLAEKDLRKLVRILDEMALGTTSSPAQ